MATSTYTEPMSINPSYPSLALANHTLRPEEWTRLATRRNYIKNYETPKWKSSHMDDVSGEYIEHPMVDHASILKLQSLFFRCKGLSELNCPSPRFARLYMMFPLSISSCARTLHGPVFYIFRLRVALAITGLHELRFFLLMSHVSTQN